MQRDEVVGNYEQNQNSKAGHGASGGRHTHLAPGKAAQSGIGQADGGEENQALVEVGPAAGAP